jgi:hypothetical protein
MTSPRPRIWTKVTTLIWEEAGWVNEVWTKARTLANVPFLIARHLWCCSGNHRIACICKWPRNCLGQPIYGRVPTGSTCKPFGGLIARIDRRHRRSAINIRTRGSGDGHCHARRLSGLRERKWKTQNFWTVDRPKNSQKRENKNGVSELKKETRNSRETGLFKCLPSCEGVDAMEW